MLKNTVDFVTGKTSEHQLCHLFMTSLKILAAIWNLSFFRDPIIMSGVFSLCNI
jgi:hypothetical protein